MEDLAGFCAYDNPVKLYEKARRPAPNPPGKTSRTESGGKMASEYSFDVVSKVDIQEVRNAIDQAQREIGTRYDFKNSVSEIEFDGDDIKLTSDDEYRLKALREVVQSKFARRSIPLETLDFGKVEAGAKNSVRQTVKLKQGIEADAARQMVKSLKDLGLKVQTQIQGDQLRVTGKNKDDLQKAIQQLKKLELGVPIQFVNYR
jgi:cyclic-di-GMP-binding protein